MVVCGNHCAGWEIIEEISERLGTYQNHRDKMPENTQSRPTMDKMSQNDVEVSIKYKVVKQMPGFSYVGKILDLAQCNYFAEQYI